ncbi:glucose-6-phosphate isomerase, partial [Patescibacteria group bacterium]|nr:glucose-6-phosphate isomerase [Patescibacteria group bacterium]
MIQINPSNILKDKIGATHGISQQALDNLCTKYQPLTQEVFRAKNKVGYDFLNLPDDSELLRKIKKFVTNQNRYKWENIVVLGIGGSALGTIAVRSALISNYKRPRVFVVDNIDPQSISDLLSSINLSKTLFLVISKSGGTTEPMALYGLMRSELVKKKIRN